MALKLRRETQHEVDVPFGRADDESRPALAFVLEKDVAVVVGHILPAFEPAELQEFHSFSLRDLRGSASEESLNNLYHVVIRVNHGKVAPFVEGEAGMADVKGDHVPDAHVVLRKHPQHRVLVHDTD